MTRREATIITPPIKLEPSKTHLLVFVSKEIFVKRVDSAFISTDLFILSNSVVKVKPNKVTIKRKILYIYEDKEKAFVPLLMLVNKIDIINRLYMIF